MKPDVQYLLECYTGENILKVSDDEECYAQGNVYRVAQGLHRVVAQSAEPYENQSLSIESADMLQMINAATNPRAEALNARQRQNIRVLARSLQTAANSFRIRLPRSLLAEEREVLQNEGLNADEMQVVNNIFAIKTSTTVSKIAECLGENLSSRTFRAALKFLCYSATTMPEELALACELIKVTYPRIQQLTRSDSIYDAISEFIEDRLDSIIH